MQALPHRYRVKGAGRITGNVELTAKRLTMLQSPSPTEFDGPGDRESPEPCSSAPWPTTDDVARCITALCHPGTYWMTGNTLHVDGGENVVG